MFPLNTVLFPSARLPLRIFEPRYVDLISTCMSNNTTFGVVAITNGVEAGGHAQTHNLGTEARIIDFDQGADGLLNIEVQGEKRFTLGRKTTQPNGLMIGQATNLSDIEHAAIPPNRQELVDLLVKINTKSAPPGKTVEVPATASELAYGLAQILPLAIAEKVAFLKIEKPLLLLDRIAAELDQLRQRDA